MSDCDNTTLLNAYHDDELPAALRAQFETHLAHCPKCAAELERLRTFRTLVKSVQSQPMPPLVRDRLHLSVNSLPAVGVRRLAEAFAAVAATILIACSVGLVLQSSAQGASGSIPVWEAKVASADTASESSDELLAKWMAQDLSRKDNHE